LQTQQSNPFPIWEVVRCYGCHRRSLGVVCFMQEEGSSMVGSDL
jgi:hypothetical protein